MWAFTWLEWRRAERLHTFARYCKVPHADSKTDLLCKEDPEFERERGREAHHLLSHFAAKMTMMTGASLPGLR